MARATGHATLQGTIGPGVCAEGAEAPKVYAEGEQPAHNCDSECTARLQGSEPLPTKSTHTHTHTYTREDTQAL